MKAASHSRVAAAVLLAALPLAARADRPAEAPGHPALRDQPARRGDWRERSRRLRGEFSPRGNRKWDPTAQLKGWLEKLKKEKPEEFEELMKLREEEPAEFRKRISALAREHFQKRRLDNMPPEERHCIELSRKYAEADDPAAKQQVKAELQEAVQQAFDARIRQRLERLERMENELKRIRRQIEERKANRDKICQARVEELTRDPRYRWDW
ncbi:MAG: hypothetical protein GXP31_08195 [Kiritimatiellaeota bacterium]|nr:hypothetical protein [Kiritimatiellota bacterium]